MRRRRTDDDSRDLTLVEAFFDEESLNEKERKDRKILAKRSCPAFAAITA
jgi:hypothetical protein